MTVHELSLLDNFDVLSCPDPEREINGIYIGDLLSWVMGKAQADNLWLTIMSNINIIAVASLTDVSCIVLTEGVTLTEDVLGTAKQKGINVISTKMTSYDVAVYLSGLIK